MFKAAVIGCGTIAQVHKAVLSGLPGVEVIACADIKPERAKAMAAELGAHAYDSAEALLAAEKPDVVHLCTPHPLHTPLAELCAAHGVHVFTEKPPVVTPEQWTRFEALQNSGVRVGICFQNRYNPTVRAAKALIESGEAGRVLCARAFVTWQRLAPYYAESDWRGHWDTEGGGALINQSIHTLDLLTWLLGRPAKAETTMRNHTLRHVIEVEDTVESCIDFESGARALFYATNAYGVNAPVQVDVVCEKVQLRIEGERLTLLWADGRREDRSLTGTEALGKDYWGNGHYACIEDFYRSIAEDRPYQNDIDSVRPTMQLMLDMYAPYMGTKVL